METKDTIKKKITTAVKLQTIIKSMKMMSFVQVGGYTKAAEGMDFYAKNVIDGLRICLYDNKLHSSLQAKAGQDEKQKHHRSAKNLYIFIGTDQGLVGNFNQLIINKEQEIAPEENEKSKYMIYGKSLFARFKAKDKVVDFRKMPANIKAVTKTAEEIVLRINEAYSKGRAENIYIIYNRKYKNIFLRTRIDRIFPLDAKFLKKIREKKWESNKIPQAIGGVRENYGALVQQYIFVQVYRILATSLSAEHFNRMMLLDRSEKNVKEQIEEMSKIQQQKRQEEITNELLDIVAGRLGKEEETIKKLKAKD